MKPLLSKPVLGLVEVCVLLAGIHLAAGTLYVSPESPNPSPPYTTWATATHVIQDAVDVAVPGDQIVVTNGVYSVGTVEAGWNLNRVALTNQAVVRSVNGPEVTVIEGATNGVRCAYVGNGSVLSGFTLRKGTASSGGGVWCESLGVVTNCHITANSATGKSASGGGTFGGTLYNCRLTRNSAGRGGGAADSTLYNCGLSGNSAANGGGASGGTLYNCTLTANSAESDGGGACGGIGGIPCTLYNCIVYGNIAPNEPDYSDCALNYCCTTPLPAGGIGNITLDPQLAEGMHLSPGSPCRGAGSSAYAAGLDIDGEPWATPPSIGCDEFYGVGLAPVISSQPTGQTAYIGQTVALSVGANGSRPLAYQWRKEGVAVAGGTNATLRLADVTVAATGDYTVVVSNDFGSVTSGVAHLTVTAPPGPYVEDFEGVVGPECSTAQTDVTPAGGRRFLGQFGNDTVSLTLTELPPHVGLTISFDLFLIQTWDADGIYWGGPDAWGLRVSGGPSLLYTTFSNTEPPAGENPTQAFPGEFPGSFHPAHTGATEVETLGYSWMGDSVYGLTFTFPHTDSAVRFAFSGHGLQDLYDESWGLDNVRVCLDSSSDALSTQQGPVFVSESSTQIQLQVYRVCRHSLETSVTVDYATTDGTAKAGEDYVAVSGTLRFRAGETNKTISIPILNDAVAEFEKQFTLALRNPKQTTLASISNVVVRIRDDDPRFFVSAANPNPRAPYNTWQTAATNIQDVIKLATEPGWNILVTNGVYRVGSADAEGSNRIVLTNSLIMRSVNGPAATIIDGENVVRGVYLGPDTILSGFSITNGCGGGVLADGTATVTNCLIVGNQGRGASGGKLFNCIVSNNTDGGVTGAALYNCTLSGNSSYKGGGARGSTLDHCTLTGNSAIYGGGASFSTLNNCTLTGNSASEGGGTYGGTLYGCTLTANSASDFGGGAAGGRLHNCTVTGNWAGSGGGVSLAHSLTMNIPCTVYNSIICLNNATVNGTNYYQECCCDGGSDCTVFRYSCTTPLPPGPGNMDADPRFLNAATGDFRLRPDSPCIDAGTNLIESITTDILGLSRPLDGNGDGVARFDMGAYEFNPYRFGPVLRPGSDGFHFTVLGEPGKTVRVERSRDLRTWEAVTTVPLPASGQALLDPAAVTERMLFYRAVSGP